MAVLRAEGIIIPDDKYVRTSYVGDVSPFINELGKLVASDVEYVDEIAAKKAEAEARRQAILDSVKQAAQISKPAPAKPPKKK